MHRQATNHRLAPVGLPLLLHSSALRFSTFSPHFINIFPTSRLVGSCSSSLWLFPILSLYYFPFFQYKSKLLELLRLQQITMPLLHLQSQCRLFSLHTQDVKYYGDQTSISSGRIQYTRNPSKLKKYCHNFKNWFSFAFFCSYRFIIDITSSSLI